MAVGCNKARTIWDGSHVWLLSLLSSVKTVRDCKLSPQWHEMWRWTREISTTNTSKLKKNIRKYRKTSQYGSGLEFNWDKFGISWFSLAYIILCEIWRKPYMQFQKKCHRLPDKPSLLQYLLIVPFSLFVFIVYFSTPSATDRRMDKIGELLAAFDELIRILQIIIYQPEMINN